MIGEEVRIRKIDWEWATPRKNSVDSVGGRNEGHSMMVPI